MQAALFFFLLNGLNGVSGFRMVVWRYYFRRVSSLRMIDAIREVININPFLPQF